MICCCQLCDVFVSLLLDVKDLGPGIMQLSIIPGPELSFDKVNWSTLHITTIEVQLGKPPLHCFACVSNDPAMAATADFNSGYSRNPNMVSHLPFI